MLRQKPVYWIKRRIYVQMQRNPSNRLLVNFQGIEDNTSETLYGMPTYLKETKIKINRDNEPNTFQNTVSRWYISPLCVIQVFRDFCDIHKPQHVSTRTSSVNEQTIECLYNLASICISCQ
jgi:hypothetical protein